MQIERQEKGRVKGYRPTAGQFIVMLALAQRDFDSSDAVATIRYQYGKNRATVHAKVTEPDALRQLAALHAEQGILAELTDVNFEADQGGQDLHVDVQIGPGDWTIYEIRSSNDTWARGRYQQLTEKLLADRSSYAKAAEPMPEVPKGQHGCKPAAWDPRKDWRLTALGFVSLAQYAITILVIGIVFAAPIHAVGTNGNRLTYIAPPAHSILASIVILAALFAHDRWRRTLLRSRVILSQNSWITKFDFRNQQADPVAIMSFYVACVGVLTAVMLRFA